MKRLAFGLLITVWLSSCNRNPEIHDLKEFCNYTVDCYKHNRKSDAIGLRMSKNEVIAMLNSMKMPEEVKKQRLLAVEKQDKEGYFEKTELMKLYSDFRSGEDEDFWRNCTIAGYEYMEIDTWNGHNMAEPIVILQQGDYSVNFKIGELIKTGKGWKIIRGPMWK